MSTRAATWLAWSLWAVFMLLLVGVVVLALRHDEYDEIFTLATIGYATVGALVASRRPENAVGWLLLAVALAFAVQGFGEVYVHDPTYPAAPAIGWLATVAWFGWVGVAGGFIPLLFPTGRLASPRWRVVVWFAVASNAIGIVGVAFQPGDLGLSAPMDNPLGLDGSLGSAAFMLFVAGNVMVGITALLAGASLILRLRRSSGVERQQLKWFSYALVLSLGSLLIAMLAAANPDSGLGVLESVGWFGFLLGYLVGLPTAIGIAILRHRLYDIDLVIKRTLVYGSLTAMLLVAYLGFVLVFRVVLSPVTGESDLAVAGSTLAVAALFGPLRSRVQAAVDRRFYRSRYDVARTLDGFSARLRDQLDLDALDSDLRSVVRDTMQPAHVSLWLREAAR